METATAARALKKRVRQQLSARLRNLPAPYCQSCSAQLLPPLLALPAFQQSSAVFCFLSMPQEVQTLPLLEHCFRLGKRVFVPKVTSGKSRDMQVLEVQSLEHIQSFPKNSWGIPEPPSAEENGEWQARAFGAIDLVVVPGVGFDSQCHRMGHGKGYYDTFFAACFASCKQSGRPRPTLVGVAFDEQIEETIPTTEYDVDLDIVVTPSEIYTREVTDSLSTATVPVTQSTASVSPATSPISPPQKSTTDLTCDEEKAATKPILSNSGSTTAATGTRKWSDAFASATKVSTEGDRYLDDFKPGRDQSDFGGFRQPDTLASFVSSKSGDVTTVSQSDADSGNKS